MPLACGGDEASTGDSNGTSITGPGSTTGSGSTTGDAATSTTEPEVTTGEAPTSSSGEPDGTSAGDTTTGGLDCESNPGSLRIFAPELGLDLFDTDPVVETDQGKPLGFSGLADGLQYLLSRDGDIADGSLDVGTHDMSTYPYHMVLLVGPEDVDCEFNPQCQLLFGLGGTWEIASVQPLVGTATAITLTSQEGCWDDGPPLDISGCRVLTATLEACFNVAW